MKVFIFSTSPLTKEIEVDFKTVIKKYESKVEFRTSGSKGIDLLIPELTSNYKVYIPWEGFNDYESSSDEKVVCPKVTKDSIDLLSDHLLGELKPSYVKIDNRLVYGLMGERLKDPVDLVIINNIDSNILPTTSSALLERMAFSKGIRVINLDYSDVEDLEDILNIH